MNRAASHNAAAFIALLLATGARRGEALGARWQDIDIEQRRWKVPLAKSGEPRWIVLSDAALRILERQSRRRVGEWVFPGAKPGAPLACVRKTWERVKADAGLPAGFRIHDLRHTFASMLVNKGRSIQEVAELLGHSQLSMTRRYAHLSPERLREAVNLALPDFS